MNYVRLLLKCFGALLVASFLALHLVQHQSWFRDKTEQKVKDFFRTNYDAHIVCDVETVNLFSPTLRLKNVSVTPLDNSAAWSWQAQQGSLYFSWIEFFRTGKINICVALKDCKAYSDVENNQIAVAPHLKKLFLPPNLKVPAVFSELKIQSGVFEFFEKKNQLKSAVKFHVDTKRTGSATKAHFFLVDGTFAGPKTQWVSNCSGSVAVHVEDTNGVVSSAIATNLSVELPQLGDAKRCNVIGSWNYDHGSFSVCNTDRSVVIDPIEIDKQHNITCHAQAPLSYVQHFLPMPADEKTSGTCSLQLQGNVHNLFSTLTAQLRITDARYRGLTIPVFSIDAHPTAQKLQGTIACTLGSECAMSGSWCWREKSGCGVVLKNTKKISMPGSWMLGARDIVIEGQTADDGTAHATYKAVFTNTASKTSVTCSGDLHKKGHSVALRGKAGQDEYDVRISLDPLALNKCVYKNNQGVLASIVSSPTKKDTIEATVDYALLHSWLPIELRKEFIGKGLFKVSVTHDGTRVRGTIGLEKGTIRIPQLYNFVDTLNSSFVWDTRDNVITMHDVVCGLHRGRVTSKKVTVWLDKQYRPVFAHVPLSLDSCFVSWQKDLFAVVSGNLLLRFAQQSPSSLSGTLFVDKSRLKGNIFSHKLQRSMFLMPDQAIQPKPFDPVLDVHVLTREPLRVKTSFLEASAVFDLALQKNLSSPEAAGKIEIVQGELKFPYKPLSIVNGVIYVVPQQMYDPLIELTAKSKVKKYGITLYVNGSIQNPRIAFESSPSLTEEQILTLLLTGVQNSSLNILMPALIMRNMQQILLGPAKSSSKLHNYFKSLLKPLSHVRIVPSFSDETGRGGLRGTIEIEVNDQLSAAIEKNFSLSEDTKFEVDYALTDDISLKGVKDERGDFGGEVEMKWKF